MNPAAPAIALADDERTRNALGALIGLLVGLPLLAMVALLGVLGAARAPQDTPIPEGGEIPGALVAVFNEAATTAGRSPAGSPSHDRNGGYCV